MNNNYLIWLINPGIKIPNNFISRYIANKFRNRFVFIYLPIKLSNKIILNTFSNELLSEVRKVIDILPSNRKMVFNLHGRYTIEEIKYIEVYLNRNIIKIPYRIFLEEVKDEIIEKLNHTQKIILYCLYTRHHDGFIRQKYLEKIINENSYFITPFIIQMIGEHVSELIVIIDKYLENNILNYRKYINENKHYWKNMRGYIATYWDTYQRNKYPEYRKYIGKIIFDRINKINNNVLPYFT